MDGLPIFFGPGSNGETDPLPVDPVVRAAALRTFAAADETARRLGMSRRRFLASACGAALTLLTLDACSKESGSSSGGGSYPVPPESTTEPEAARDAVGGEELVFDVQTHLLEYDLSVSSGDFGASFPQADCGEDDERACFSVGHYLDEVFLRSDTSLAVLSAIPAVDPFAGPLSMQVMAETRNVLAALRCDDRLLVHGQAVPTSPGSLDAMDRVHAEFGISAWKVYTHVPRPWMLDGAVGEAFLGKVSSLGAPKIVCVHKGFGGMSRASSPVDVGPAARAHPDISFVVYHSGYEPGQPQAVDRLLRSMADAGVGPNANVYAELGSTWWSLMTKPDDAAHVLGKLLRDVGEDNVLWGTDSIWYGSPQGQLQAFRAFQISPELQERFGYPALTPEVKAKVLGLNAARLYGVDPKAPPTCAFTRQELEQIRTDLPSRRALGPRTARQAAAVRAGDWAWH